MNSSSEKDCLLGHRLSNDDAFAYNVLIHVFKYLDIDELLQCSKVCKIWSWIAFDAEPWKTRTVYCCNGHIKQASLVYGYKIRDFAIYNPKLIDDSVLIKSLANLTKMNKIKLYGCHKDQLLLLKHNNYVESVTAEIKWGTPPISIDFVRTLKNLTHLEIISYNSISGLESFKYLKNLKHLTFTAPCERRDWMYIVELERLESLKLSANIGITWDTALFDENFYLRQLKNLHKLHICDLPYLQEYGILGKIKDLSNLKELILQNISISRAGQSNFNKLIAKCKFLEKLTISIFRVVFYNNILDVALENSEILKGASGLRNNLREFTWIMDPTGISKVREFYDVDNATVLKVKWSHLENGEHNIRYPWAIEDDIAPVSMNKLLTILKKRLPYAKVNLLKQEEGDDLTPPCSFCDPPKCTRNIGRLYKCKKRS